jgi:hypothetical protein
MNKDLSRVAAFFFEAFNAKFRVCVPLVLARTFQCLVSFQRTCMRPE